MNAQLPQIVNENVFPNGCSFWGCAAFRQFGHSWQLLCWNTTSTASGNECDLHSGCLWVLQKLGNFTHCFVLFLMMWGVSSIILGSKSLYTKRNAQHLQKKKIKRCKSTMVFFSPSMPDLLEWEKINQWQTCSSIAQSCQYHDLSTRQLWNKIIQNISKY